MTTQSIFPLTALFVLLYTLAAESQPGIRQARVNMYRKSALAHGLSLPVHPDTLDRKTPAALPDEKMLQSYAGTYEQNADTRIVTSLENGKLYANPNGEGKTELKPKSDNDFEVIGQPATLSFEKNAAGIVTHMVLHLGTRQITAKRL